VVRTGAPAFRREVTGVGLGQPEAGRASGGPTATARPVGRGWGRGNQALHRGTWSKDGTQWTKIEAEEVETGCEENLFPHKDSRAMEEAAQ